METKSLRGSDQLLEAGDQVMVVSQPHVILGEKCSKRVGSSPGSLFKLESVDFTPQPVFSSCFLVGGFRVKKKDL
jgi:hypothetical protein